jgi:hypothetical protein
MDDTTVSLFRAMGDAEFESVMSTKVFTLSKGKAEVKYFGLDFDETLSFANKAFNLDLVCVLEVCVKKSVLDKIGDYTHVDPFLFKCGTVEIQPEDLAEFNGAIITIIHRI